MLSKIDFHCFCCFYCFPTLVFLLYAARVFVWRSRQLRKSAQCSALGICCAMCKISQKSMPRLLANLV